MIINDLIGRCGKEQWRDPKNEEAVAGYINNLIEMMGTAVHFAVQLDFMKQTKRLPLVEYSIPESSKYTVGNIGFADLVSFRDKKIWEIKPSTTSGISRGREVEIERYVSKKG